MKAVAGAVATEAVAARVPAAASGGERRQNQCVLDNKHCVVVVLETGPIR